jgi:hypothetical protein
MEFNEFKRKIKTAYPSYNPKWTHNEVANCAYIAGIAHRNFVHADSIHLFTKNGTYAGRAHEIEQL